MREPPFPSPQSLAPSPFHAPHHRLPDGQPAERAKGLREGRPRGDDHQRPRGVAAADRIVLPGVGAFPDAVAELRRRSLVEPIRKAIASGKPFLGICLGLQLLFDDGHEGGQHEGLGIIRGEVCAVRSAARNTKCLTWAGTTEYSPPPADSEGLDEGMFAYFVHSYHVVPEDREVIATETDYGGPFCSMVWRDNMFATQFHPEKSQTDGLRILKNFAELKDRAV